MSFYHIGLPVKISGEYKWQKEREELWETLGTVPKLRSGLKLQQQPMFIGTQIKYPHLLVSSGSSKRERLP